MSTYKLTNLRLLALFLTWVVLIHALIPLGFMPDLGSTARGLFKITLCTMYGARDVLVDKNQNIVDQDVPDQKHQSANYCAYGAGPTVALETAPLLFAAPFFYAVKITLETVEEFAVSITPSGFLSRGPPVVR